MLHKVNKADMEGTVESLEEYLKTCCGIMIVPLAYIFKKTITIQMMIERMLHLSPDKNKLQNEQNAQSVKKCTTEYGKDNRNNYNILDRTCKDTDLNTYIK